MNRFRWGIQKLLLAMLLLGTISLPAVSVSAQENIQRGVVEGVLVAKGDAWIAVRPDNSQEVVQFTPRWVGGLPRMGGGLDKRMLAIFQQLVIGSRLKVVWLSDERPRAVEVQVLPPRDGGGSGDGTEKPRSGVVTGVVTAKGATWISIRPDGEQESTKLIPRWIGGLPKNGGGFDKQMLALIAQTPVGARVRVEWIFQEHLRVVALRRVE